MAFKFNTMKRFSLLFVFLFLLLVFNSCNKIKGKGDVVSQIRNITGFTAISLAMEGDLYFTPDSVYSVEIQAQQNILDVIETPVEGGRLILKIRDHTILGKHEPIRFYIYGPSVNNLDISGSGNIATESPMNLPDIFYNISGSGNIIVNGLNSKSVNGDISGSGNLTASSGTSDNESLSISGSGNINFLDVVADSVYITISGSGDVKVYAVKYLRVTISEAGMCSMMAIQSLISIFQVQAM